MWITLSILGIISPRFDTTTFEPIFRLSSLTTLAFAKLALLTVVPAINRSPDEILSTGSGTDHYKPIKITGLEIGIDINPDLIIRWKKATKFLALPVDKMFPTNYRYWWLP